VKKPLLFKFLVMAGLTLLLMVPMGMIDSLIKERSKYRDAVVNDIAKSVSHSQTISGPILVVPYTKGETEWTKPKGDEDYKEHIKNVDGHFFFLPKKLEANIQADTESRKRGIYETMLYHSDVFLSGHFDIEHSYGLSWDFDKYTFHTPYLVLGVSDVRGIESAINVRFAGTERRAKPGTKIKMLKSGFHAPINSTTKFLYDMGPNSKSGQLNFNIQFKVQGTSGLSLLQLGEENDIHMTSDWPHPSFKGNYLPSTREVGDEGFNAHWHSSIFSNNVQQNLPDCATHNKCSALFQSAVKVDFINPTDQYVKADRATKYALLFIALTFIAFFVFEVLKRLRIHPIQYTLVGAAMALFYLLLVSLSEHIAFHQAYIISASACILLIGFYIIHILQSVMRAGVFTLGLGGLYGLLYGLLGSEDYALLMGSSLLFAVLGLFMMVTRKLDWYEVSKGYLPAKSIPNKSRQEVVD